MTARAKRIGTVVADEDAVNLILKYIATAGFMTKPAALIWVYEVYRYDKKPELGASTWRKKRVAEQELIEWFEEIKFSENTSVAYEPSIIVGLHDHINPADNMPPSYLWVKFEPKLAKISGTEQLYIYPLHPAKTPMGV